MPVRSHPASGSLALRLTLVACLCFAQASFAAATRQTFVGSQIPSRIYVGSHFIYQGSDSLILNGTLLVANQDYRFDSRARAFDLASLEPDDDDTLLAIYNALPAWLNETYGRSLTSQPTVSGSTDGGRTTGAYGASHHSRSGVTISGAKTFRFSTRSVGSNEFSQSLDLTIDGPLTDNLSLTGAISDRGYSPSYGTANSRLSEFDKISLALSSPVFRLEVGDMEYDGGKLGRNRRLAGAALNMRQTTWSARAVVARPDGRFATARFLGANNVQGPYVIAADGQVAPIVPGSETVWLDGQPLERGADRDYAIDYPAGRITIGVRHPIDSRSRIEIDYEPLLAAYRGELVGGGGGLSTADSSLTLAVDLLREGDDPNEPTFGDLTGAERDLLGAVGDDADGAFYSGVATDTAGSYDLVTEALPDSVFQYVGPDNGGFRLSFSHVGTGQGDYRFIGNGVYEYVGSRLADYLPLIRLQAPERTDHLLVTMSGRRDRLGLLETELHLSNQDHNLLSTRDDGDNLARFVRVKAGGALGETDSLTYQYRYRESGFSSRQRLFPVDLARTYLTPDSVGDATNLALHELGTTLSPVEGVRVRATLAQLDGSDDFRSRAGAFDLRGQHHRWEMSLGGQVVRAESDLAGLSRTGRANRFMARTEYRLASQLKTHVEYEYDQRWRGWIGGRGTEFDRWQVGLTGATESLRFEHHREDSLATERDAFLNRKRLVVSSQRRWGRISYAANLTHQWLEDQDGKQAELLSRLSYQYRSPRSGLDVGGAYTVSTETRNARGLTYLEVDPGEGNYLLIDGVYVPDPDGNYLQLEELLSDRADVRHGQKSFHLARTAGNVSFRFDYNLDEELKQEGERSWSWLIPFLSDDEQPYLYYLRSYQTELRLWRLDGGYAINVVYQENLQMREIASVARKRINRDLLTTLKQQLSSWRFEELLSLFWIDRDEYYSGAGQVNGHKATVVTRYLLGAGDVSCGLERREAASASDERSETWSIILTGRMQLAHRGELRGSLELYRQALSGLVGTASYSLTDNHQGEQGAIWSLSTRYGPPSGLRLNLAISGSHADDRRGRVTARGELVAGF